MVLFSSFFALAQTDENWKTFAPDDEEFSVESPVSLRRDRISDDGAYSRYHAILNGTYFYIFSANLKEKYYYDAVSKFLFLNQKSGTAEKIGEFESEKFEFADAEDFHHKVFIVKTKNRLFIFQTISPTKDNSAIERFFASIKLTEKPLFDSPIQPKEATVIKPKENETQKTEDKNLPQIVSGIGSGTGQGSGTGDGTGNSTTGSGIGTGKTNQTTAPTNETKALKILSKPRPNYTDAARFYSIQGTVTLRVTFLANGQIGTVTPTTKLPLGLTTTAITAAKGITFEPAMKNGVAYSVTKVVQYSFTIY